MTVTTRLALGLFALVLASGCTVQTNGQNGPQGGTSGTSGSPATNGAKNEAEDGQPAGRSCSEILTCLQQCSADDSACGDACVTSGTAEARGMIDAINVCLEDNACEDMTCANAKCGAELTECKGSKNATPTDRSVPAELVGKWSHSGGGSSIAYAFAADGTYHESSGLSLGGACSSTSVWDIHGNVSFGADVVTFERVSGTLTKETCSEETAVPLAPETKTKSWKLDGGKLYTWDADCADYLTCGVDFERL